jgi:succinate dehydrogenase / fumarate reductase, cytochrome b subunit
MNALLRPICALWNTSIGKKWLVAITGLALVVFLLGHLAGNMLVFAGAEAFDEYAKMLHESLHGAGIWIARIGLLAVVSIHIAATISLTRTNRKVSPNYEYAATIQAKKSSLIMIWSGLTILAFIIFHILHFTVRTDAELASLASRSPHAMVIKGFQNIAVVIFYVIAMTLLCSHASHGVQSMFQTLGLRSKKSAPLVDTISKGYALLVWAGFISIPLAVMFGFGG